jgi:thiamine biosynthesis lipoprotein
MITHIIRGLVGLLLAAPCLGAEAEPETALARYEFAETHMGSEFKLVLYSADEASARSASRLAFARIASLDAALSDYQPESELMRLCDRAGGPPIPVSQDLFDVLERSIQMYERSGGAYDVTIGPVVRLWRRARRDRKLPDPELLTKALALVGSDKIRLDARARTVQLLKPGMKLDLGAIAKGYASEEARKVLNAQGVTRALVAGSGDIVVGDPPPGADGWTIGIAPLDAPDAPPSQFLRLKNAAVSTSGDSSRFVEIGGRRYSHIIDPKTGLGMLEHASVTVVALDGATADALDTTVYILGPEKGLPLVESLGAAAFIVRAKGSKTQIIESRRIKDYLIDRPQSATAPAILRP